MLYILYYLGIKVQGKIDQDSGFMRSEEILCHASSSSVNEKIQDSRFRIHAVRGNFVSRINGVVERKNSGFRIHAIKRNFVSRINVVSKRKDSGFRIHAIRGNFVSRISIVSERKDSRFRIHAVRQFVGQTQTEPVSCTLNLASPMVGAS
jgi:hypothetical protein